MNSMAEPPRPLKIVDLDHLMIRVHTLADLPDIFGRLGFTVAPVRKPMSMADLNLHGRAGSSPAAKSPASFNNRHVLFKPYPGRDDVANFLEFMCIEDQSNIPPPVTQLLSFLLDSIGPKMMVLNSKDIEATCAAMRAAGFQFSPPASLETGCFDAERGTFVRIFARPATLVFGQAPFHFTPYETSTLEGYHYTPWTVHANGAKYMAGVSGVTQHLHRDAQFMAQKVFGASVRWIDEDIAVIHVRDLFLRIVTPAGFVRLYPGFDFSSERVLPHLFGATIAVESLDRLRTLLNRNAVEFRDTPQAVYVPRQLACNTLLEFVPADRAAAQ